MACDEGGRVGGLGSHPLAGRDLRESLRIWDDAAGSGAGGGERAVAMRRDDNLDVETTLYAPAPSALGDGRHVHVAGRRGEPIADDGAEGVVMAGDPWGIRHGTRLWEWQRDALSAWQAHGHVGIVQAVTGTGKTRVGVVAMAQALKADRRCVVLVPGDHLVRQWLAILHRELPNAVLAAKGEDRAQWDIRVTTVQTAMNQNFLMRREMGMVVADECHRYGAPSYSMALRGGYDWRLGLSATAGREDDGDEILRAYFHGICFDLGYRRAARDHLIAPYDVALVGVPLEARERVQYESLSEELRLKAIQLKESAGIAAEPFSLFMTQVGELARDRSSTWHGLASAYLARSTARKDLLARTSMKQRALQILTPVVHRSHGSLVFTQTKESAREATAMLEHEGIYASAVHSGQSPDEREEKMFEFAAGATRALSAPRVLDEGIDVPDADFGVVVASHRSRRQMIQRMGRVLRRKEGDRPARFAVMYAIDTVEDPHHFGAMPAFFRECLPYARQWEEFDLRLPGESVRLLEFLGVTEKHPVWEAERQALIGGGPDADGASAVGPGPGDAGPEGAEGNGFRLSDLDESDGPARQIMVAGASADPVKDYLRQIGKHPLLDAAQEVELARRIEAGVYAWHLLEAGSWEADATVDELGRLAEDGRAAEERLIVSNLRLVVSLAKRWTGRGMPFLDLIQEGNIGLIRAVEKFDYRNGAKFSTYGTWWIKQAITRAMADQASTIRIPVHFVEKMNKAKRWLRGRGIGLVEAAAQFPDGIAEIEITHEELVRLGRMARPLVSIDSIHDLLSDSVPMSPIHGEGPVTPGEGADPNLPFVWRAMETLQFEDPRTARILMLRWGFETGEEETLDAIGTVIGVTRERVRQLEKQGVERVRRILRDGAAEQDLPENRPALAIPAPRSIQKNHGHSTTRGRRR